MPPGPLPWDSGVFLGSEAGLAQLFTLTQRLDKVDGIVEGPFNLNHLISRFLIKLLT